MVSVFWMELPLLQQSRLFPGKCSYWHSGSSLFPYSSVWLPPKCHLFQEASPVFPSPS